MLFHRVGVFRLGLRDDTKRAALRENGSCGTERLLLQGVHMQLQSALEVGGLVLVHDVVLGELVEHRGDLRKQGLGSALLGRRTQGLHGVAGRLVEQTVVGPLGCGLTNPFLR